MASFLNAHQRILGQFCLEVDGVVVEEGQVTWSVEPLGNGNINGTFLVTNSAKSSAYVLQEINHFVFKDVDGLMNNMVCVTEHLKRLNVRTLELVSVRPGDCQLMCRYHYFSPCDQTYWRVFKYIPKCKSALEQDSLSYEDVARSATAFGDFQYQLRSLPVANLKETIPNFHDTRFRFESFLSAVQSDLCGFMADKGVQENVEFVMRREEKYVDLLLDLQDSDTGDRVPLRVVHNDTKSSNILLSEDTGEVLCVIDLDTVMPGRSLYDFADIVRSSCSSCGEEEADCSRVHLRLDMFRAAAEGYLASQMCVGAEVEGRLCSVEIEHLWVAGQVCGLMCMHACMYVCMYAFVS